MTRQVEEYGQPPFEERPPAATRCPSNKPSALRMRRLLDRRRRGFKCLTIEFCPADVDGLVRGGFLDRQHRADQTVIELAIRALLGRLCRAVSHANAAAGARHG